MVDIMLPLITCIFVVFDLASGGVAACANHEWKSSEMRKGLYHKFGSIMLVVLAYLIDYAQKYVDLGFQIPIAARTIVCNICSIWHCCKYMDAASTKR